MEREKGIKERARERRVEARLCHPLRLRHCQPRDISPNLCHRMLGMIIVMFHGKSLCFYLHAVRVPNPPRRTLSHEPDKLSRPRFEVQHERVRHLERLR